MWQNNLKLLIPLPPPTECWDYRHAILVFKVQGMEPRALGILGSTDRATSPGSPFVLFLKRGLTMKPRLSHKVSTSTSWVLGECHHTQQKHAVLGMQHFFFFHPTFRINLYRAHYLILHRRRSHKTYSLSILNTISSAISCTDHQRVSCGQLGLPVPDQILLAKQFSR